MSDIIIKINKRSYKLLKSLAKGGEFNKELKNKEGYYYISINRKVYDELAKIDDDLDKAIFYAVLNEKVKTESKAIKEKRYHPLIESLRL